MLYPTDQFNWPTDSAISDWPINQSHQVILAYELWVHMTSSIVATPTDSQKTLMICSDKRSLQNNKMITSEVKAKKMEQEWAQRRTTISKWA